MVEIPDELECVFSASVEQDEDSYSIEVPHEELDVGTVSAGETYRVVILEDSHPDSSENQHDEPHAELSTSSSTPPVSTGDIREVTIESLGDQGDGIAKIERGYVLIIPRARPGDKVTVEIENARQNVAFAKIHESDSTIGSERRRNQERRSQMKHPVTTNSLLKNV